MSVKGFALILGVGGAMDDKPAFLQGDQMSKIRALRNFNVGISTVVHRNSKTYSNLI